MIRSSKHILKYQTKSKTFSLEKLFEDYKLCLEIYIDLILQEKLPLQKFLSSKLLPNIIISHGQWKQVIYKNASEIVRSSLKKHNEMRFKRYKKVYKYFVDKNRMKKFISKRFSELKLKRIPKTLKINLYSISINIDSRLFDISKDSKEFDEFINLKTPYREPNGKYRKSIQIKIPLRHHKHSLKFNGWTRKKTIKLLKINNNFYFSLIYEKENPPIKSSGYPVGCDVGYKKLIVLSDNQIIGLNLEKQYLKISKKKQESKNFKQNLKERDKLINQELNKINFNDINQIFVEDLKNIKHKSKFSKKVNNKLQRWSYPKVFSKLGRICEENGILLTKVPPFYTSQTCSNCKTLDKDSRKGELFKCNSCNLEIDADLNASINILQRGVYNPSSLQNSKNDFYSF